MKLGEAKKSVEDFFDRYGRNIQPSLVRTGKGKVYELYCLAKTVEFLRGLPGVSVRLEGSTVDFKASPGMIDRSRSYFVVDGIGPKLELHTDIEVRTLSSSMPGGARDLSSYHEVDLALVVGVEDRQRPAHYQIVLGVECKAQANFEKDIVRQVLGVRRELSLLGLPARRWLIPPNGGPEFINANPASEYWLAFVDPKGARYRSGPAQFGVEFLHWCPR